MDSLKPLKVLQIVGYKNSGKTTLIREWIHECLKEDKEIAVIKHHGHQNGLVMPSRKTDSMVFFEAGAKTSIVSDDTTIQLHQRKKDWSIEHFIFLARLSEPSIIFIEGFKEADYPKVVMVKNELEWQKLKSLSNIVLIVFHDTISNQEHFSLSVTQTSDINDWLKHWLRGD